MNKKLENKSKFKSCINCQHYQMSPQKCLKDVPAFLDYSVDCATTARDCKEYKLEPNRTYFAPQYH